MLGGEEIRLDNGEWRISAGERGGDSKRVELTFSETSVIGDGAQRGTARVDSSSMAK